MLGRYPEARRDGRPDGFGDDGWGSLDVFSKFSKNIAGGKVFSLKKGFLSKRVFLIVGCVSEVLVFSKLLGGGAQ